MLVQFVGDNRPKIAKLTKIRKARRFQENLAEIIENVDVLFGKFIESRVE